MVAQSVVNSLKYLQKNSVTNYEAEIVKSFDILDIDISKFDIDILFIST